jgi:4'-phosphopantetheinyl transferase
LFTVRKIHENGQLALLNLALFAEKEALTVKREIEKRGAVFLLKNVLNKPCVLEYTPGGKPYLKDEAIHISISHSHQMLAIICDTATPTGVDIEQIRDKVIRIRRKFLNKKELACAGENVEKLITYWACKETLYKINDLPRIDFVKHLAVEDFEMKDQGIVTGEVRVEHFHKKYRLQYEKLEDYMLVYVLNEA